MKPLTKQREVLSSSSDITLFGFTAGSGRSSTLVELSKRLLDRGEEVNIIYQSPVHCKWLRELVFSENSHHSISQCDMKVTNSSGGFIQFVHKDKIPTLRGVVLIDDVQNYSEDVISVLPRSVRKVYASCLAPDKENHWLEGYLGEFLSNDYLDPFKCKKNSNSNLLVVYYPFMSNPFVSDEYYRALLKSSDSCRERLILAKFP